MTIAQSEESCVVYGMPKAAIERGYATRVVASGRAGVDACRRCAVAANVTDGASKTVSRRANCSCDPELVT